MANNRITEGVGKKIVEALKMQPDEIDVTPVNTDFSMGEPADIQAESNNEEFNFNENDIVEETPVSETFEPEIEENTDFTTDNTFEDLQPSIEPQIMPSNNFAPQPEFSSNSGFEKPVIQQSSVQSLDEFEVPSNVAVLKQLISKLPAGVTKQTGALIIKQTMEALGISMRSVLQEAQQVQEGLNNSTRECQASIAEYKRQIGVLEKQAQKYQRQYSALNDIISLFVQTNF